MLIYLNTICNLAAASHNGSCLTCMVRGWPFTYAVARSGSHHICAFCNSYPDAKFMLQLLDQAWLDFLNLFCFP